MNQSTMIETEDLKAAILEANRCLGCHIPKCAEGCPISNEIPHFIAALGQGNLGEARRIIARKSNLPAICGRVCAHELQCEGHCVLNSRGNPIRIGMLERVVADFGFDMNLPVKKLSQKVHGRVAVIGSGPAGLTVAGELAKLGFEVVIYEAQEEPGGILLYGIPSFRLSKDVVRREISMIKMLGVEFQTSCIIGVNITVDQLFERGFDAVFIGSGTALARDLPLEGRELSGIIQSSYLLRMNYLYQSGQLDRSEVPVFSEDNILVIGAGNVGIDAARTAKRLGAKSVTIVCRGTREKMPAIPSEAALAEEEDVVFLFEHEPQSFVGSDGMITALRAKAGEYEVQIPASKIFLAIGSRPANRIISTAKGIEVDKAGYVVVKDRPYGMTTRKAVFAGGDVVHCPATVVLAMKEAKRVAEGIAEYINAVKLLENT